jgi:L-threonylcarbamoyladenylate synthase
MASRVVAAGGIIAYPTEGVFGLGCNPFDCSAVLRLLDLKNRPVSKGLIVIAADFGQIEPFVEIADLEMQSQVLASWPGPNTWLLPARVATPRWLTGAHDTLAVRVTAHPLSSALCRMCGPLISSSANPSGRPAARSTLRVRCYFRGDIDFIVPGSVGGESGPTLIRDGRTGAVIRPSA